MIELLGGQICPKSLFLKFCSAPLTTRPILRFKTTLYIKLDHMRQLLSRFRHFRKNFYKNDQFSENFLKLGPPKPPKKTFWCNGKLIHIFLKWLREGPGSKIRDKSLPLLMLFPVLTFPPNTSF